VGLGAYVVKLPADLAQNPGPLRLLICMYSKSKSPIGTLHQPGEHVGPKL
jgi:hypothetical protein